MMTENDDKRKAQLDRLRNLTLKRNEARKLNHKEVTEEDKRNNLPKNWEAKKSKLEWQEEDERKRKDCEEKGEDYDRVKLLDVGAEEAERYKKKKKKPNADPGFSDYEQATFRQYKRLSKQIKPNFDEYCRLKDEMGDETFYAGSDTLGLVSRKDQPEAVDKMVADLDKQVDKRSKYSRRRRHDPDADIDYINERNKKYNKKLDRFYGQYTEEIKQNLERGTAV